VYELVANVELLFRELGPRYDDRIRAAAADGFDAVEFWWWRGKDLTSIETALRSTGTALHCLCTDPMGELVDPRTHDRFVAGLTESARVAENLGARYLIATAGDSRADTATATQDKAVREALLRAADVLEGTAVVLLLENLNSRVEHVGTFVDTTPHCLDLVVAADSEHVRCLFDLYHSAVMGEDLPTVLGGRAQLVSHVHIADAPGRHEPGTGEVAWDELLLQLHDAGYRGRLGLEYTPTGSTSTSVAAIRRIASRDTEGRRSPA